MLFTDPETDNFQEIVSGQYVIGLPLRTVVEDTRSDVVKLSEREASDFGRVERHRNVNHNIAVLAGTRIPVKAIRSFIEDGFQTTKYSLSIRR